MRNLLTALCLAFVLVAALFGTVAAQEISQDPLIEGGILVTPLEYDIYGLENSLVISFVVTNTSAVTVETQVRFHIMAAPQYSRQAPEFITDTMVPQFDNTFLTCPPTETCSGVANGVLAPGETMVAMIRAYPSTRMGPYIAASCIFIQRYMGKTLRIDGPLIAVTPKVYSLFPLIFNK